MIKTPVSKSNDYDDEFIYDVDLFDSDGDYICLSANESVAADPVLPTVYTTEKVILATCKPVLWSEIKNDHRLR